MQRRNSFVAKLAAALSKFNAVQRPLKEVVHEIEAKLFAGSGMISPYAKANQAVLTGPDSRSVALPAGTLAWRKAPRTVTIEEDDEELVIRRLKRLGLGSRFVRKKEEVDRAAMLKNLPEIEALVVSGRLRGVKISAEGEEFFTITPAGSNSYLREHPDGTWTVETPKQIKRRLPD